jgi:hypothetical protein
MMREWTDKDDPQPRLGDRVAAILMGIAASAMAVWQIYSGWQLLLAR